MFYAKYAKKVFNIINIYISTMFITWGDRYVIS